MAVTSVNLANEVLCRDLYLNYYKHGNTRDIDISVISQIEARYCNEVGNYKDANGNVTQLPKLQYWNMMAEDDYNAYEFTDEEWDFANASGWSDAEATSGTDGKRTESNARTGFDAGLAVAGAGSSVASLSMGGVSAIGALLKGGFKGGIKAMGAARAGASSNFNIGNSFALAAAFVCLAIGTLYMVRKPNKQEIDALNTLKQQYDQYIQNLQSQQTNAQNQITEMENIAAESESIQDTANSEVERVATFEAFLMADYERIQSDITAGKQISEEDRKFMQSIEALLEPYKVERESITEDAAVKIGENYYSVEAFQSAFDTMAGEIGNTQGVADFAASFDEATRNACIIEAVSQGLNAISGVVALAQVVGLGPIGWVAAAAAAAGTGFSTFGAIQQIGWAADAKAAIDHRANVQTEIETTTVSYEENLGYLEGGLDTLENMQLETGEMPPEDNPIDVSGDVVIPEPEENEEEKPKE